MAINVAILAAGIGSRFGSERPKPLAELANGRSILQQQVDSVRTVFGPDTEITIVVGFMLEEIVDRFPDVQFVFNEEFEQTDTSESLLRAMRATGDSGLLWINGNVVFELHVMRQIAPLIHEDRSFVVVRHSNSPSESPFSSHLPPVTTSEGSPDSDALGDSVGINYIAQSDKSALLSRLEAAGGSGSAEQCIGAAITHDHVHVNTIGVTSVSVVTVAVRKDLEYANTVSR